jgi:hypothetical protein
MKVHDIIVDVLVNENPNWETLVQSKRNVLFDPACQMLLLQMRLDLTCEPITIKRRESDLRLVIVSGHDRWTIARLLKWNSIPCNIIE